MKLAWTHGAPRRGAPAGGVAMIFAASLTLGVATAGGMPSVIITGCERFPDPRDCPTLITRTAVDVGEMTPVRSGRTVIYTLTFDNAHGAADARVDHVADLTRVVDDAAITGAPAVVTGTGVAAGQVTRRGGATSFRIRGGVAAGAVATVTFAATVRNAVGDRMMELFLVPAGAAPPRPCVAELVSCTANPVVAARPRLTLALTTDRTRVAPGGTVTFRLAARNVGTVPADRVTLCADVPGVVTLATARKRLAAERARVTRGRLCWALGTLAPGMRADRRYTVRVRPSARAGRITAGATLDRTNVAGTDARASRSVTVAVPPAIGVR